MLFCEIILLPNEIKDFEKLKEHLLKKGTDYQIVSNNGSLIEFLKTSKDECYLLEEKTPSIGKIATKIYQESLDLLNKYKKDFASISHKEIEVFEAFEYSFLQQLMILKKTEHIFLENKNVIFIFVRMFPIYFSILDIANNRGYENNNKICILDGDEIKYKKFSEYKIPNKLLKSKTSKYIKNTLVSNFTIVNIKSVIKIIKGFLILNLQKKIHHISKKSFNKTSKKIQTRITKFSNNKKIKCLFFVTSSGREDIYLNPWYPIFFKLKKMKISFILISGDTVTDSILYNKQIDFLNLYKDINLLSDILKNSDEGKKLENQMKKIIDSSKIEGIVSLSNYLMEEIFRSISIMEIVEPILLKNKFETLIGIADGERLERTTILLAQKLKIKNFSMLPIIPNPHPYFADWYKADKIFVPGQKGVEILEELGYNKNKLIITGNPKYDFFQKLDQIKLKKNIMKKYGISFEKIILVGMSRWHKNDEKWMSDLIKFCSVNKLGIIIKIHPTYKISNHEESESKIKFIKKSCEKYNFLITYDENIYELISASDILITEFSTVGIEAVLLNKPVITVNFSNEDLGQYVERLDKINASFYIEDYVSLEDTIKEIFKNNETIKKLKEGQNTVRGLHNFSNDGMASERIISYLLEEK
jgi:CDP-glycerol glycerophosphotransferase (TagB/SpsB family)